MGKCFRNPLVYLGDDLGARRHLAPTLLGWFMAVAAVLASAVPVVVTALTGSPVVIVLFRQ